MDKQLAAQEVIKLKKQYDPKADKNLMLKNKAKADQLRQQYGLDESKYGANVSLADAYSNYYSEFGNGGNSQQEQPQQPQPYPSERLQYQMPQMPEYQPYPGGRPNFELPPMFSQESMDKQYNEMKDMFGQNSSAYYESQKSQFDKMLSDQLTQLEMAYGEAVNQGKLSVNEAMQQFEQQKKQLEQSAYQQAEATKAYGNEMGLQHSQQMIGLQQSDTTRFNSLHNENANIRDKRVNDIKDRINLISKQKDLDIARANVEHGYNLAGASAQSQQMYAQQMAQLSQQDYFTKMGIGHDYNMFGMKQQHDYNMADMQSWNDWNKFNAQMQHDYNMTDMNQQFNWNMSDKQLWQDWNKFQWNSSHDKDMFDKNAQHDKNMTEINFNNRLQEMEKSNQLDIKKMYVGKEIDLDIMNQQMLNQMQIMAKQHGYNFALESQSHKNALSRISAQAASQAKAEASQYEIARKREYDKLFDKNSMEYKINKEQMKQQEEAFDKETQRGIKSIIATSTAQAYTKWEIDNVLYDPMINKNLKPPTDYTTKTSLGKYDPVGNALNWLTGFKKNNDKYKSDLQSQNESNKKLEAILREMQKYK